MQWIFQELHTVYGILKLNLKGYKINKLVRPHISFHYICFFRGGGMKKCMVLYTCENVAKIIDYPYDKTVCWTMSLSILFLHCHWVYCSYIAIEFIVLSSHDQVTTSVSLTCIIDMYHWHVSLTCIIDMYHWHVLLTCIIDMYHWHVSLTCRGLHGEMLQLHAPVPYLRKI